MTPTEANYRKSSAAGATGISLLIALCDTLAGDLRRAAQAERANHLEQRCNELNHALMVIGVLEDRVSRGSGGELADQLTAFYQLLRRRVLLAQARRSPEQLEEAMAEVLKVRESWQNVQLRPEASAAASRQFPDSSDAAGGSASEPRHSFSWSA
jgi:flagellar protein FliS